ncbi:MAG: phospholipase D family protein, partial [Rhodocyclaceae bacterium]|nr:phospholipase D family protein [Rhodocyclaceae bacterium]
MRHWLWRLALWLPLALWQPLAWAVEFPASGSVAGHFTPWDDAEGALLAEIGAARRTIHVQAFLLTSRSIARALVAAHARGVRVEVLADREMVAKGENSQVPQLHAAGIPVRLETRYAAAHNKIVLIDAEGEHPVVITGSYNFTFSAQARNAENLLILRGNRPLAQAYLANWRRHRDEALPWAE